MDFCERSVKLSDILVYKVPKTQDFLFISPGNSVVMPVESLGTGSGQALKENVHSLNSLGMMKKGQDQ